MLRVRGRVQRGRLVVDEPTELPEGFEVDLFAAEGDDDEDWAPELDRELVRRYAEAAGGEGLAAEAFLAKLRARRTA